MPRAVDELRSATPAGAVAVAGGFCVLGIAIIVDLSRTVVSVRSAREHTSAAFRSNTFHFGGDLVVSSRVRG